MILIIRLSNLFNRHRHFVKGEKSHSRAFECLRMNGNVSNGQNRSEWIVMDRSDWEWIANEREWLGIDWNVGMLGNN